MAKRVTSVSSSVERPPVELTVSDLAQIEDCSRWTAARKMRDVMAKDPSAVFVRGRALVGIASKLAQHIPGLRKTPWESKLDRLEGNQRDTRKRQDGQAHDHREYRRVTDERLRRLESRCAVLERSLHGGSE